MRSLARNLQKFYNFHTTINRGVERLQPFYAPQAVCHLFKWKQSTSFYCTSTKSVKTEAEILNEVCQGDPDKEHRLKVIMLEMELLRQEGERVPEDHEMATKHYVELLNTKSRSGRKNYLEFLFKICRKEENQRRKKLENAKILEEVRANRDNRKLPLEEFVQNYSLTGNTMFIRFSDTRINHTLNGRLIQAMMFGQKLVIDCGFHSKMTQRENNNCSKQLTLLFSDNRNHDNPFDLHFCNFEKESSLSQNFAKRIPVLYEPDFPINLHRESYLDLFPRENLVYLTPHCRTEMTEFDHEAVYIIGGIVDKTNQEPVTMAKAKQERIRMVKFPLDRHLVWGGGSGKSLTLDQVIKIMLDMKKTNDWKYALRHVPRRKLQTDVAPESVTKTLLRREKRWKPDNFDFENLTFRRSTKSKNNNSNPVAVNRFHS